MASAICQRAISDAFEYGSALLKFISANDVGLTGSHQYGFLLPKDAWSCYTIYKPEKGSVKKHPVKVLWQDGLETDSVVTWYGDKTRSEYRLTRFGKDFPFRTHEELGNLLVIIPKSINYFIAYVLEKDDEFDEIQSALGVEVAPGRGWARFEKDKVIEEAPDDCIHRNFRTYAGAISEFPTGDELTSETYRVLLECVNRFPSFSSDKQLTIATKEEYNLFRLIERQIVGPLITSTFKDVDEFLELANNIMNRRKSRAGRSLENHVERLLRLANIPFEMRADVQGKPDVLIPGKAAYDNKTFPLDKLFSVGIKRTCKDRWRQILEEAPRLKTKYILTLQPGISPNQLIEMKKKKVQLIIPADLQKEYPKNTGIPIHSVDSFFELVKRTIQ